MANQADSQSDETSVAAVKGEHMKGGEGGACISSGGIGFHRKSLSGQGMVALRETHFGPRAVSIKTAGVRGSSNDGWGIVGHFTNSYGVVGNSAAAGAGMIGLSNSGIGVHGKGGRLAGFLKATSR